MLDMSTVAARIRRRRAAGGLASSSGGRLPGAATRENQRLIVQ